MSQIDLLTERLRKKYSPVRTLVILTILPLMVFLVTWGGIVAWNKWGTVGDVSRVTDRNIYFTGEPIQVSINTSSGSELSPQAEAVPQTSEVVFALDVSGSMGGNSPGEPFYLALSAVKALSRTLLAGGAAVGFVAFDDSIDSFTDPTNDISVLMDAWNSVSSGGGTDIAQALKKSSDMLTSNLPRFVVLVSDGAANQESSRGIIEKHGYQRQGLNDPIPTQGKKILFMGVGIGSESTRAFFENVFYYPHQASCCDAVSSESLARKILDVAVEGGFIDILGDNLVLRDFPHVSAQPYEAGLLRSSESTIIPLWDRDSGTIELSYPYLLKNQTISYTVRANALGIHPIAEQPLLLNYTVNGVGMMAKSGPSPWVLVVSPWLLLLMLLPSLIYGLLAFFGRNKILLGDPKELPSQVPTAALPPVPRAQFRRGTLEPLSPSGEDGMIPTAVIAIGRGGAEVMTALFANRLEAGINRSSDRYLPIYIDCVSDSKAEEEATLFKGCCIDLKQEYLRIPKGGEMQSLIQDIVRNPAQHHTTRDWLDTSLYRGKALDISTGCEGDRMLARLALYKDISSGECQIETLRGRVGAWGDMWKERGEKPQIMFVFDPRDGVGSGWIQDMGFQLRNLFGENSIPIYAVLNEYGKVNNVQIATMNRNALLTELKALQGASGCPIFGLERKNDSSSETSVKLPLFDRLFELKTPQGAMHPAAAASAIMELMDANAVARCHEILSNAAALSRAASYRERELMDNNTGIGFLTHIKATTVVMPIFKWHREICCWAMRDLLSLWFGYRILDGDRGELLQNEQEPKTILKQLREIGADPAPTTLSVWDAVLEGNGLDVDFPTFEEHLMRRDLLMVIVNYLNNTCNPVRPPLWKELVEARLHRFGNVIELSYSLLTSLKESRGRSSEKKEMQERAYKVIKEMLNHLNSWQLSIIGENEGGGKGVVHQLAGELNELQKADPSIGQGRLAVPIECIQHSNENWYREELKPRLIDSYELPIRVWWVMGADGKSMDILFHGLTDKRLHLHDVATGQLLPLVFDLLRRNLAPEIATWSMESHSKEGKSSQIMGGMNHGVLGHSMLYHAFHQDTRIAELRESVSRTVPQEKFGIHSFPDRITLLTVSESNQNPGLSQLTSLEEASRYPLIQPLAKIPAVMYQRHLESRGSQRVAVDLKASCKLLAQSDTLLSTAVAAVVGKMIREEREGKILPFLVLDVGNGSIVELTHAGDTDMEHALFQLLLAQRDSNANEIGVDEVLKRWQSRPIEEQKSGLETFIEGVEEKYNPEDWEQLLMWKARSDLQGLSGSLS